MIVKGGEGRQSQIEMLPRRPGHAARDINVDPDNGSGEYRQLGRKRRRPCRSQFECMIHVETASENRDEPDSQSRPEVGPRIQYLTKMPETQAEIDRAESPMQPVERLVESVSDPGDGENHDAEENRKREHSRILRGGVSTVAAW